MSPLDHKETKSKIADLITIKHFFQVPLSYEQQANTKTKETITLFARELRSLKDEDGKPAEKPYILFLQGGPGFESPRPESGEGWIKAVLALDYRVLLLDQRGTGLSSPVCHESLAERDTDAQLHYLKNFRADSIVKDCELIRGAITGGRPWTVLGQSFGGFCTTTYLSFAPQGLSGALITGGLPPLSKNPDQVYMALYPRVLEKNDLYYKRFPEDGPLLKKLVELLESRREFLPTGEVLSRRRLLQAGLNFGFTGGGITALHYLLERAFRPDKDSELSFYFKSYLTNLLHFNTNPIYALLHEAIYCQGQASDWSAERLLSHFPQFNDQIDPPLFTGEMIYPWMFEEYNCLKPLRAVAEKLAEYKDWDSLYDPAQLGKNTVPCAAALYFNDMYVDRELSMQTASQIKNIKLWITNEFEHDGLRRNGDTIVPRLLEMVQEGP